jgi:hypothetical protein
MTTKEEIILEARRKNKAGDFDRKILSRMPSDYFTDDVTLECGHTVLIVPTSLRDDDKQHCGQCAREWIAEAQKQG